MCSINFLPNELLVKILESFAAEPRTLLSTSLVARRWSDPSQQLLHEEVHLVSRARSDAWMKEGARWRSVMSKLDARFVAAQGRERLREVLEGCTRLKELTIELQGEQLDLLALPSLRGVTTLHLIIHRPTHRPSAPFLLPSTTNAPLLAQLTSFTLTSTGLPPPNFLSTLFASPSSSSRVTTLNLTTYTGPRTPHFFHPLHNLTRTLLHLSLGLTNLASTSFLSHCTSLTHFSTGTLYSIPALVLPPTLRELRVEQGYTIEALALLVRGLPALEMVQVGEGYMSRRWEVGAVFVLECRERGVRVGLIPAGEGGESIEGGDWLRALQHSSSLSASAPSPQQHPQPQPQSLAQPLSLTPTTIKVA